MTTRSVACIKWGAKFSHEHVNRLYAGVARNLPPPFRFICVTDDPSGIRPEVEVIPLEDEPFSDTVRTLLSTSKRKGAFGKVSLFKPSLFPSGGRVLGFDLDVVITGPLKDLFEVHPGKVCMRHDWLAKRRGRPDGHGSVFRFDPHLHCFLYEEFAASPGDWMRKSKFSEQKYTSMVAQGRGAFAYFPPHWIASFKRDSMRPFPLNHLLVPRQPPEARVVCFHGNPKIEEAIEGFRSGPLRSTLPCDWLKSHWAD